MAAPGLLLSALAAGILLAACGGSASGNAHSSTLTSNGARAPRAGSTVRVGHPSPAATPLSDEEMREYDANEGRCHDDGGSVRDVGSVDAYCAFPNRANDFHLVESSRGQVPSPEEE